ncbi:1-deoxy-D-xylulose 5-phosphate reductoisomerase [Salinicola rhizosphaerae]|uniref:1-deoxy-D-xylulose 5-phosphate reductoisomerase n=1 Tax=Salinicola rhizosphaerae TaxID=1443141 RepID=A0ABQ3DZM9_9GAMM|nr:1-deoxy-D-xylulose 5-phosphate reductoisomerase [Salinicola rhizosphaerae]
MLGATGSIGRSTLDVVARYPDSYRLHAATAQHSKEALLEICLRFRPRVAVIGTMEDADWLRSRLRSAGADDIEVTYGKSALQEVSSADAVDTVMAAIVGAAGLMPTLAAVEAGKRVLLANKESLVMSGALFMDAVARSGATLLPIDSEHNAIYQCLPSQSVAGRPETGQSVTGHAERHLQVGQRGFGSAGQGVSRLLLTASGGPFREWPQERLASVTPEQACAHPNWSMGRKISVDSATLMNKGLELIEACWLFDASPRQVEIVVHPQSIIHSMVGYSDGSVIAQMGNPDMRTPIAYGLAWPDRIDAGVEPLDLFAVARLDFEAPDEVRFPCLRLAREAIEAGGTAPASLNAANEVAVAAFLEGRISFPGIGGLIEETLSATRTRAADSLDVILCEDAEARRIAEALLQQRSF